MKLTHRMHLLILFLGLLHVCVLHAAPSVETTYNELSAKIRSMTHGFYSEDEWTGIIDRVENQMQRAEEEECWDVYAGYARLLSTIYSDVFQDNQKAVHPLMMLCNEEPDIPPADMEKVYVRCAELYAYMGDEQAVYGLIRDYRHSPYFAGESYSYSGGRGPHDPLKVMRPSAKQEASTTLMKLETYRKQARYADGKAFPDFDWVDVAGRRLSNQDFQGHVLLVVFWARNWKLWDEQMPVLLKTYQRYHAYGFDIIGINQERRQDGLQAYIQQQGLDWPQVIQAWVVARKLGVYGEAANFLVDPYGRIIDRDVWGADLNMMLKKALGLDDTP